MSRETAEIAARFDESSEPPWVTHAPAIDHVNTALFAALEAPRAAKAALGGALPRAACEHGRP